MKIMSGKTGAPHVTSQQFRQLVEGTVGQGSYILNSGENLEAELSSNNLLKIRSGIMSHHGNLSVVDIGTYDEVTIQNGTQGMKRIDLIVNRYTKNDETGIEENEWVVIMGTPDAESPVAPAYTEGNLQEGDLVDDCPVFEVHLDGINVTEVVNLLSISPDIPTLNASLSKLSDDIDKKEPTQKRVNFNNIYYKNGYNCFLHANSDPASDVIIKLSENYRPRSAAVVSGWCRNTSNNAYYPCVGVIGADGQWDYLSAMETIGATSVYYIYKPSQSIDRRSRFQVWLTGAWSTSTNGS